MTDTQKNPTFDHEEYLDTVVQPLIAMARQLCFEHGIPLFYVACFKSNDDGVHFASGGCPTKDGWVPNEFRMIRAVVDNNAAIIPLNRLVGEALVATLTGLREETKGGE